MIKKYIFISLVVGFLLAATVSFGARTAVNYWTLSGNDLIPRLDAWNVVMGNITIGGVTTGDLDMGTDIITNIGNTGTNFVASTGALTLAGDLTITGDDLFMTTNTAGYILVADGTNYNPTNAISASVDTSTLLTIQNTDTTITTAGYLLELIHDANDDADANFLICQDDGAGTPDTVFSIASDGSLVVGGSLTSTFNDSLSIGGLTADVADMGTGNDADLFVSDDIEVDGSFFLAGSLGIGDTTPAGALTVGDGDDFQVSSTGVVTLANTGRVIRHLRVGAGSWELGNSAPDEDFEGVWRTTDFDNTTDDEVHYTLIIPYRWDSTTDVEFAVDWFYDGAGSPGTVEDAGTVCWALEYKSIEAGELVTGAGTVIAEDSAGSHSSDKMVRTTFTTKLVLGNLAAGDSIGIRLYRDVDGGATGCADDTLAVDAIINTHFHFTENKLGQELP